MRRVSHIVLPDPFWRYFILFQSWEQFFSWLVATGSVIAVGAVVIWQFGDPQLIPQCAAAAFFGGAWSLIFASKAQFSIRAPTASEKVECERILKECLYVELGSTMNEKRFVQNMPRLLRWSDSDVSIVDRGGVVIFTGPQTVIRRMRRLML
jgi:hypothetical protein